MLRALMVCWFAVTTVAATAQPALTTDERCYLIGLVSDTWLGIAYMADTDSGLPEDNTERGGYTSVSNIGLYLACVPAAQRLHLIDRAQGLQRVSKVIEACEKLPTWEGFPHSWLNTKKLGPTDEQIVSPVDLGNYEAGLIVCRQAYPELRERIDALIEPMNWQAFYCPENGWIHGGWSTKKASFTKWYYNWLAADSRTASFLSVAHGAPLKHWESLVRTMDDGPGPPHFAPGWMGGGLFMQTMTALFIDEAGTPIGRSAANFTWAQIRRGHDEALAAWGWSACATPDGKGYLGYGRFDQDVITPHATALAMLYFPHEAVANLQALEKLGAREPLPRGDTRHGWGMRDSLNLQTGQVADRLLILDQAMLLLACANMLADGCVRDWFQADPLFEAGRRAIGQYQVTAAQRDEFWRQVQHLREGRAEALKLD